MRLGVAAALALLAGCVVKLIGIGWFDIGYPYELDYGEGIVWQQMRDIMAGRGYAPLGLYPAIVYHYPPVYHLTVGHTARLFATDPLATGRAISLAATFASMAIAGWLAAAALSPGERRSVRLFAAAVAGCAVATSPTVLLWSSYMRVDMLACALSLGGLALTIGAANRPLRLAMAALCFVLAIYTKQISIAAPAAAFAALWLARPRAAWTLLVWCMGLGIAVLVILEVRSGGGFVRHVLLYNLNRVDLSRAFVLADVAMQQAIMLAIATAGALAVWRRLRQDMFRTLRRRLAGNPADFAAALLLAFLIVKTAMLPTIMKSGAASNYLIEWLFAVAIFAGVGVIPVLRFVTGDRARPAPLLALLVVLGLPVQALGAMAWPSARHELAAKAPGRAAIVARIRASAKPVVSDDMVLLLRGGQPVRWEPAIAAELAHAGLYDEAGFARLIRGRRFGFFVTFNDRGDKLYDERYSPALAAAIDDAYPVREQYGGLILHLPR